MSETVRDHHRQARRKLQVAVLTVSDSRTLETDVGGKRLVEHLQRSGHRLAARELVPDQADHIQQVVGRLCAAPGVDAVLVTGGTGITARDVTYEAIHAMLTKELPGYGELFRYLSYQDVGPAALLSRTIGGVVGRTVVLTMPGSPKAVDLAMERLILPELPHLVDQAHR